MAERSAHDLLFFQSTPHRDQQRDRRFPDRDARGLFARAHPHRAGQRAALPFRAAGGREKIFPHPNADGKSRAQPLLFLVTVPKRRDGKRDSGLRRGSILSRLLQKDGPGHDDENVPLYAQSRHSAPARHLPRRRGIRRRTGGGRGARFGGIFGSVRLFGLRIRLSVSAERRFQYGGGGGLHERMRLLRA